MLLFWNRNICEFKSFELLHHMIMYHVFCATRYVFPINVIYHLFVARHRFHSYIKSIIINYIEQIWIYRETFLNIFFVGQCCQATKQLLIYLPSRSISSLLFSQYRSSRNDFWLIWEKIVCLIYYFWSDNLIVWSCTMIKKW